MGANCSKCSKQEEYVKPKRKCNEKVFFTLTRDNFIEHKSRDETEKRINVLDRTKWNKHCKI